MDTKTLYSRLSSVPPILRTQFGSEGVLDAIEAINQHFKIAHQDEYIIAKLLQRLQIKDISAEYFSGELAAQLNIDKDRALAITAEIKRAVLAPMQKELSDYGINLDLLEKFQMPIIKNQALNSVNPATPVPMDFQPAPKMIAQTFQATPKFAAPVPVPPVPAPKPVPILAPMSAAPQPAKPFDAGWSKATPQGPVVRLGTITPAVPVPPRPSAPVVAQTPKPAAAQPTTPGSPVKTVSEFDRLDILKGGSAPKPAPAPAPKPPEPAPVMLHQVSTSATVQNSPDIQAKLGARDQMKGSVPMPAPVRPAILEFGTTTAPVPPAPKPAFAGGPRMPAPPPIPSAGPRTITEVTTPKQQVTAPPPVPPGPRTPPATEKSKVIVKDFL